MEPLTVVKSSDRLRAGLTVQAGGAAGGDHGAQEGDRDRGEGDPAQGEGARGRRAQARRGRGVPPRAGRQRLAVRCLLSLARSLAFLALSRISPYLIFRTETFGYYSALSLLCLRDRS